MKNLFLLNCLDKKIDNLIKYFFSYKIMVVKNMISKLTKSKKKKNHHRSLLIKLTISSTQI